MRDQLITFSDGRKLGYVQRGPENGRPIFYFHGSPSSGSESELFIHNEVLEQLNIQLIAVDRPGINRSDFQAGRMLLDWPKDVLAVADSLEIDRFAILAYSMGGPYGLACGYAIPERLTRVGIVSGAAVFTNPELMVDINPGTQKYLNLPREKPWMAKLFLNFMKLTVRFAPKMLVRSAISQLPDPDKIIVEKSEMQALFINMVNDAFRQGTEGVFQDSLLMISDWGYQLTKIEVPVILWHGEDDHNVPMTMAEYVAELLPNGKILKMPGEGHLSLFASHVSDILQVLVE